MADLHLAQTSNFAFVDELLSLAEAYTPQIGDVVVGDDDREAVLVRRGADTVVLRALEDDEEVEVDDDSYLHVERSAVISGLAERHLRAHVPDGVAFADDQVPAALVGRLRATFQRLVDTEPVDYHPGSGTKVRDLVHPSLYPFVAGRSVLESPVARPEAPAYDRFGRAFEGSRYQWLPTPFRVAPDGMVTIAAYINNLDRHRHPAAYQDLADLFATALPLLESVVGYVDSTRFWQEDCGLEHEGELPEKFDRARRPAPPRNLRGRELLVIPKIVEYTLREGETHEGVWHVEGMSHEHIVATCLYVLDRDDAVQGGELRFKRAYTVEEAGQLFWRIEQSRPAPVEALVAEATIPVGSVGTPAGRWVVFPNSHIHQLGALALAAGAPVGRRRVIVFWLVDPDVSIPATRDVPPQQGTWPHAEALEVRLALMEERRRHKQSHNVRAVSLCEH